MKTNLKINGQQTVRVGAVVRKPQMVLLSFGVTLNGGPQKVPGAINGRQLQI